MTPRPRPASTCAPARTTSRRRSGAAAAVKRYNHSDSYVDLVLAISARYAQGDFTQSPNGYSTSPVLTSSSNDQTLSAESARRPRRPRTKANNDPSPAAAPAEARVAAPVEARAAAPAEARVAAPAVAAPAAVHVGGVTGLVDGLVTDLTGGGTPAARRAAAPAAGGGSATLTWAEAKVQCLASGISVLDVTKLLSCITSLLS